MCWRFQGIHWFRSIIAYVVNVVSSGNFSCGGGGSGRGDYVGQSSHGRSFHGGREFLWRGRLISQHYLKNNQKSNKKKQTKFQLKEKGISKLKTNRDYCYLSEFVPSLMPRSLRWNIFSNFKRAIHSNEIAFAILKELEQNSNFCVKS